MVAVADLDKRDASIRDMFAEVAPRYDFLNHLLSASLDRVWRRRAAAELDPAAASPVLDLCCGTGDQALALHRRGNDVVAADFCLPMLALARRKYGELDRRPPAGLAGSALELPFADAHFGGVTVSFGLRNVADLDRSLAEVHRVLRPGGKLVVLEFAVPAGRLLRSLYLVYFRRVLPWLGRLFSPRGAAYSYLPASVLDFPQRHAFCDRMAGLGFSQVAWRDLSGGIVTLYSAVRRI